MIFENQKAKPQKKQNNDVLFSVNKWADIIGVDNRTVTRKIKSSGIKPNAEGLYSGKDLYAAMTAKQALEESKARKLKAEAEMAEMERDKVKGTLYDADRIREEFTSRIAIVAKRVENLRKYANRANPQNPGLATEVLNEAARHILQPVETDEERE